MKAKLLVSRAAVYDFFSDALGRILLIIGVVLLFLGLLFFGSSAHQWTSAASLFLGTLCFVTGIALYLESPIELKVPSKSGLGTILMCISALLFVGAMILVFVIKTPIDYKIPEKDYFQLSQSEFLETGRIPFQIFLGIREIAIRPFAWLAPFSIILGFCTLLAGFLLKFLYA